jgi:hypothetical protein
MTRYEVGESATETVANDATSTTLSQVTITNNSGGDCEFTVSRDPLYPGGQQARLGELNG